MQHTRYLHYVDEVARAGSIRKAAERLNIVSSAVNRRILDIEREVGAQLFERLPRGVRLTSAGEIFVVYARSQMAETERMRSEIEALNGLRRGEVRLAVIEAASADFLPRLIADFQCRYPKVAFRTTVCGREEVMQRVLNFEADLGLALNPPAEAKFRPLMVVEQRVRALVAADHPLTQQESVRVLDCLDYPVALPAPSLGGRVLLNTFLANSSINIEPALESNSYEMMRNFARLAGGVCFQVDIGISPRSENSDLSQSNDLVALPLTDRRLPVGKLVMGMHHDRALPVAAAKFAQEMELALSEF
ncbi:LysR family transcriptional regulator [Marinobacter sp. F3R08]|uniref:LysR family transcriptional regulator n=1 Tax=Marinobacter sp. F3R08 TaxID=2841559 RepID=UPI001C0986EC|nr:LysR family transcriptional regulator [Marinobacter sp. F3R08]MBU2954790.1 LysR family transcriptional regulator [Marinobacter sp. F3R08]